MMSLMHKLDNPSSRLRHVVDNENGFITHHSQRIESLKNGIEHYFVEVTCTNGMQYGIQGYGSEAIELHKETMRNCRNELT